MSLVKIFLIVLSGTSYGQTLPSDSFGLDDLFGTLNNDILQVNHETAQLAWDTNFGPFDAGIEAETLNFADKKRKWIVENCSRLKKSWRKFDEQQERIYGILCHGMKFTSYQEKNYIDLSNRIEKVYTSTRICLPKHLDFCHEPDKLWNSTFISFGDDVSKLVFNPLDKLFIMQPSSENIENLKCFTGEPELESFMTNDFSKVSFPAEICIRESNSIHYWIWEAWRAAVGPAVKTLYFEFINLLNTGAQNNGIDNVGDIWKQEMDLGEDVEGLMKRLMDEVQPLYDLLHAFTRTILKKKNKIKRGKNLPAHVLGWNANWYNLFKDDIEPEIFKNKWNMGEALKLTNWQPTEIIKRVEDFYTSTGLNRLSSEFWNKSLLAEGGNESCHGTAADMFQPQDFRMIICGCKNLYDFYVIIHETGHIEQYMLAQEQLAVFRPGNTIVQETIGDAFFLAMMTPIHLNRLRLIDDQKLFPSASNDFDLHQLMMMAFMKLPDIPFGYVFEKFRYDLFANRVDAEQSNDYFWELTRKYQHVVPPNENVNRHDMFDAAAKFHLAANVPYARYFFANILQYQVFRALCEKTFYGRLNTNQTLTTPLHKCDIYGSKRAGNTLKKALKPGSSISLQDILISLTGSDMISADAMKEYYKPLMDWIRIYLRDNEVEH